MAFPPPLDVHEHRLTRPVGIQVAARMARCDRDELAELNPALSDTVVSGRRSIPAGYRLRLPAPAKDFGTQLAALPEPAPAPARVRKASTGSSKGSKTKRTQTVVTHRVRKGETISHIAARHRVSIRSLLAANGMTKSSQLKSGQVLRVPTGNGST
jgi:membrane-bound lytic murein transglycosylase D